jgi:hypothetical protein
MLKLADVQRRICLAMMTASDVNNYLWHEPRFKVLICLNCQHCLTPNEVENYVRRVHPWIPIKVRKELVDYSKGVLVVQAGETQIPSAEIQAIEGLKVIKGIICNLCEVVFGSITSMEVHCRNAHSW